MLKKKLFINGIERTMIGAADTTLAELLRKLWHINGELYGTYSSYFKE